MESSDAEARGIGSALARQELCDLLPQCTPEGIIDVVIIARRADGKYEFHRPNSDPVEHYTMVQLAADALSEQVRATYT